jgi:biotin carboxylase
MSRVLVLGSDRWQLAKAAELGLSVVLVQKPAEADEAAFPYCDRVYLFDYQDLELITRIARREHAGSPFSRVVTQSDIGQVIAGHLNDLLDLAGNSERTVRTLHDKFALRQVLNAADVSVVPCRIAKCEQDLRDFAAEHGAVVIKPRMGHSSMGVRVLDENADLEAAWQWWDEFGAGDCLLEKRLVGHEFSAESFSLGGEHVVVATTDKVQAGVIELGHTVPAVLDDGVLAEVRELVSATMSAVGVVDGPGHTEIMLTPEGPKIVEAHSRRPGDRVNLLVDLVFGVDMERETFRLALGGTDLDALRMRTPALSAASIRFVTSDPGTIRSIDVPSWIRDTPGVAGMRMDVEPGRVVHELRWSFDRCGWVAAVGPDPVAARELADRCAAGVRVEVEPFAAEPPAESMSQMLQRELGESPEPLG